ncbi:MAG: DMT family transporter [Rhodobacteraceae bacterium]|nr:DMT family transporter [Paracoccaceae bacterium]
MENLRAIALMITAMVFFTLGDMAIKLATHSIPTGQILATLGFFGGLTLGLITHLKGHRILAADFLRPEVIWRNLSEIAGTLCMVTALSLVDLSTVAAILQATPLAVTLGAAVILREHVGWRRWSATLVGFVGVLIIMRPGLAGFELETLWALAAMIGLSMRDLSTRLVPRTIPTLRIATYGMTMLLPAGLMLLAFGQDIHPMGLSVTALMALTVAVGVAGYVSITAAMRMGEVSVVAPFRYSRIIFALAVGALVFGERPDGWTLLGAAITVLAGLYIFMREGRKATQ